MKTKHTPGPWTFNNDSLGGPLSVYATNRVIDDAFPNEPPICQCLADSREGQDVKANARLIACAPELLDALGKILSIACERGVNKTDQRDYIETVAKLAITKATGQD